MHEVEPVIDRPSDVEHRIGGRQQGLGRNRVGHRAVAAELVVFDEGDVCTEVRCGYGGRVPGGSTT